MLLDDKVLSLVGKDMKQFGLLAPSRQIEVTLNRDMLREMNQDADQLASYISENEPKQIPDQAMAYRIILAKVDDINRGIVSLQPGALARHF